MNSNQFNQPIKEGNLDIEDGEIADKTIYTSIYLDASQDLQQLTSQLSNLNNANQGFFGTESKRKAFNPDEFQQVTNFKLKDDKNVSRIQYSKQKVDTLMTENDEQNELLLNDESQNFEANIIRNEDSFDQEEQIQDKAIGKSDFSNSQVDRYLREKGISSIKKNSLNKSRQHDQTTDSSLQNQVQPINFNKPSQLNFGFEEIKDSRQNNRNYTQLNNDFRNNHVQQNDNQEVPSNMKVATQDFAQLMRSKQEIYGILLNQGQYYLPPYQECTIEFLRDVFAGRKRLLTTNSVRIVNVPKLNELTVTNLIEQVKLDQHVMLYLPELKDKRSVNRQYLYNIINTIKPEFFPDNIRAGLELRKQKKSFENRKYIEIQSDIYDLLKGAINLNPSQRGRALHLLNVGAKKRKRPERPQNLYKEPQYQLSNFTPLHQSEQQMNMNLNKRKKFNSDQFGHQQSTYDTGMIRASVLPQDSFTQSMIQPQTYNK